MKSLLPHTACWAATWNTGDAGDAGHGLEQAMLAQNGADSVVLAFDEEGTPFRLAYQLEWNPQGRLLQAHLQVCKAGQITSLALHTDGSGNWQNGQGEHLHHLDACIDIDIWPTPLTNSLPLWRSQLQKGQRREFLMAWVAAPDLTVEARPQAYTRLADKLFLFESLDGSGFKAELALDGHGLVIDYPGLFRRVW